MKFNDHTPIHHQINILIQYITALAHQAGMPDHLLQPTINSLLQLQDIEANISYIPKHEIQEIIDRKVQKFVKQLASGLR